MNETFIQNREATSETEHWQPLFGAGEPARRSDDDSIYTSAEIAQLIHYEQLQAERLHAPTSLLVCPLNGSAGSRTAVRRIVRTIKHTVRGTDHIGWITNEVLAVLLPGASTQAAELLKSKLEDTGLSGLVEIRVEAL